MSVVEPGSQGIASHVSFLLSGAGSCWRGEMPLSLGIPSTPALRPSPCAPEGEFPAGLRWSLQGVRVDQQTRRPKLKISSWWGEGAGLSGAAAKGSLRGWGLAGQQQRTDSICPDKPWSAIFNSHCLPWDGQMAFFL